MHTHCRPPSRSPAPSRWELAAYCVNATLWPRDLVSQCREVARGRIPDSPCWPASRGYHSPRPLRTTFEPAMAGQDPLALSKSSPVFVTSHRMCFRSPVASCDSTWCVLCQEVQQTRCPVFRGAGHVSASAWHVPRFQTPEEAGSGRDHMVCADGFAQRGPSVADQPRVSPASGTLCTQLGLPGRSVLHGRGTCTFPGANTR